MKDLNKLFEYQIKELYSAAKQLLEVLIKMVSIANISKLKKVISDG